MKGSNPIPPVIFWRFLKWYCKTDRVEEIEGDLNEEFNERIKQKGSLNAKFYYMMEVMRSFNSQNVKQSVRNQKIPFNMKHNVKFAYRSLLKRKFTTTINVSGLALSFLVFLMAGLYINDELSYNSFHQNLDQIYRITTELIHQDKTSLTSRTPNPLAPAIIEEVSEIQAVSRVRGSRVILQHEEKVFWENDFYYVDQSFLEIFSFNLVDGNKAKVFEKPFSLVLTESSRDKYFGTDNPIGESVLVKNQGEFMVTGVIQDVPGNSQLTFDFLASYSTLHQTNPGQMEAWDNLVTTTFVLLRSDKKVEEVSSKLNQLLVTQYPQNNFIKSLSFYPFKDIYLYSELNGEIGKLSDFKFIYIFAGVAVFILLIASINFINLSTAQSSNRLREIGTRKALGAFKSQLISQFLTESVLLSFVALSIAIGTIYFLLPYFNFITGKELSMQSFTSNNILIPGIITIALVIGAISGIYPAYVITALSPVKSLKNENIKGSKTSYVNKLLVILQFALAIILITGTYTMYKQLNYLQNKDLGFDKEHVLILSMRDREVKRSWQVLKNEILAVDNVKGVTASYHTPGGGLGIYYAKIDGSSNWIEAPTYIVDEDFLSTMGIALIAGNGFSADNPSSLTSGFLINETAVKEYDLQNPLGTKINWDDSKHGEVIGIVNDFHIKSLHQKVPPLLIFYEPDYFSALSIRIDGNNIPSTIDKIKKRFKATVPNSPFEYSFLDQNFDSHYKAAQTTNRLVANASLLAIVIALMGLFGMLHFSLTRKRKEFSIRKVYGASMEQLLKLTAVGIIFLVGIALLIGIPFSHFLLKIWLQEFAYHADPDLSTYLFSGLAVIALAVIIAIYQTIKIGITNPAETLRYE